MIENAYLVFIDLNTVSSKKKKKEKKKKKKKTLTYTLKPPYLPKIELIKQRILT